MVVQLGDLLRRLLNAGERDFSLLTTSCGSCACTGAAAEAVCRPLTIWMADLDGIPACGASLILQPLIENAVVHGLTGHNGPVEIRVESPSAARTCLLRVINTIAPQSITGHDGIGCATCASAWRSNSRTRTIHAEAAAQATGLRKSACPCCVTGRSSPRREGFGMLDVIIVDDEQQRADAAGMLCREPDLRSSASTGTALAWKQSRHNRSSVVPRYQIDSLNGVASPARWIRTRCPDRIRDGVRPICARGVRGECR